MQDQQLENQTTSASEKLFDLVFTSPDYLILKYADNSFGWAENTDNGDGTPIEIGEQYGPYPSDMLAHLFAQWDSSICEVSLVGLDNKNRYVFLNVENIPDGSDEPLTAYHNYCLVSKNEYTEYEEISDALVDVFYQDVFYYINDIDSGEKIATYSPTNLLVYEKEHTFSEEEFSNPIADSNDIVDVDEDDVIDVGEDEEDIATISEVEQEPVDTKDLVKFEYDKSKHEQFIKYADSLEPKSRQALLEALKSTWGGTPELREANLDIEEIVKKVNDSKMLALKQRAATIKLDEYHRLAVLISETLQSNMRDSTLGSLRIDGVKQHIGDINARAMMLSTAIYDMARELDLGVKFPSDVPSEELPADTDVLLRILTHVKYGTRTWATIHRFAAQKQNEDSQQINFLKSRIEELEGDYEDLSKTLTRTIKEYDDSLIDSRSKFTLGTAIYYVTSTFDSNSDDEILISPMSLELTDDREDAIEFATKDDATIALEQIKIWAKRNRRVKNMFKGINVNVKNMFVGQVTVRKV